jgi:acetolactate decarboxylase
VPPHRLRRPIGRGIVRAGDELHQIGTLAALSAGGYAGTVTIDDMLDHGDFGLGTFEGLDGEMIVLDGDAGGAAAEL